MLEKTPPQFSSKFQLLNKSELNLYNQLCAAAPKFIVFAQVSMPQIFHNLDEKKLFAIGKKSIDFLLCRKNDTRIMLAIELNGIHHQKENQKIGDEIKKTALEAAGIPLLTINAEEIPAPKELSKLLAEKVNDRTKNEKAKQERIDRSKKKASCASCKSPVSQAVVKFCESNKEHFKNKIFCPHCQLSVT